MATQYKNDKGFLVLKLTQEEAAQMGWGCICMSCNREINEPSHLFWIAALNDIKCNDCFEEFLRTATRYDEDIPYEQRNYDYAVALAKSNGVSITN